MDDEAIPPVARGELAGVAYGDTVNVAAPETPPPATGSRP